MATTSNLFIDRGSDYNIIININDASVENFDLTDYTIIASFKKSYYSNTSYTLDAVVYGDPLDGNISITLTSVDSLLIKPGRYVYDIVIVAPDTVTRTRVLEGILTLNPNVS